MIFYTSYDMNYKSLEGHSHPQRAYITLSLLTKIPPSFVFLESVFVIRSIDSMEARPAWPCGCTIAGGKTMRFHVHRALRIGDRSARVPILEVYFHGGRPDMDALVFSLSTYIICPMCPTSDDIFASTCSVSTVLNSHVGIQSFELLPSRPGHPFQDSI